MQLFEKLQDAFNNGDEEIRKWFLVGNNYLPFMLILAYIIMSVTGPIIMKNRIPFQLQNVMVGYNFGVVITYLTALFITFYYLPMVPWEHFCRGTPIVPEPPYYPLAVAAWSYYILKYVQFLDTLFYILRKKEHLVSPLHILHHSIMPILGWIVLRTEKSGMQSVPAIINGIVHIFMYTYFGLAAMGPKMRKYLWWKKYLTGLQIIQFILIILFVTVIAPMSGCPMVISSYLMDIFFASLFLLLFYRFFKTTFKPTVLKKNRLKRR